jgi:hypothetical protein
MLNLKTTALTAGISFIIGATSAWWITADYKNAKYEATLSKIRFDAEKALNLALNKALEIERKHNQLAEEIEVQNAKHREELDAIGRDNERLVAERGLYDRGTPQDNCPVPASADPTTQPANPPTGTRLSKELEQFLLRETRRADQAASYAKTCYEWIQELRKDK